MVHFESGPRGCQSNVAVCKAKGAKPRRALSHNPDNAQRRYGTTARAEMAPLAWATGSRSKPMPFQAG